MGDSVDDLSLKRALDALPKEIAPPADDWPAVRARLRRRRRFPLRAAALLTLLALSAAALVLTREQAGRWTIRTAQQRHELEPGDTIITRGNVAHLTVGSIGTVDVDPSTDAELLEARWSAHRLALRRGTIHARITAPPRLFVVETPSGTAVDLGCAYTLEVDSAGNSAISVTAGWVSFESVGRYSLIPAGMHAAMRPGGRPGTPLRDSASPALAEAVHAFDAAGDAAGRAAALQRALASAHRLDAVTLWHLVLRSSGEQQRFALARLMELAPPSPDVRRALETVNEPAMRLYWTELPGTLPIVPGWRRALWLLWLRLGI